eukprot:TRINITY_DN62678_c0_g1_i1.p1 TRINITY_DN62678_c0_g1~~TRINITY_DN62678_c0_g1_i1.p1  ORF type:complete len:268 (-),score=20.87 TRINITY_DN62678_c0_g1_i1:140-856(-)
MATADMGRPPTGSSMHPALGHSLLGLSHIKRAPKWSFNGRQTSSRESEVPGPGAYMPTAPDTSSKFSKSPNHAFGISGRETLDRHRVPGPGRYDEKKWLGHEGKSFSLTPRRGTRARENGEFPGPGAHEMKTHIGEGPKFSASPRRSLGKRDAGPGPGKYDQTDAPVAEKQPRWGFGTSQRPDTASGLQGTTPGPGAYLMGSSVGEGPKYSMQARRLGPRPQPSPGPGAHGGHYTTFA